MHNRILIIGDIKVIFGFEGPEYRGPQSLRGVTLTRPRPHFAAERSSPAHYRAYSTHEDGKTEYVVEFVDTREEVIRVTDLRQAGRTLEIAFRCVDPFLDSKLAFALLRKTLLDDHFGGRYADKVDAIRFKEPDLFEVKEPWAKN